MEEDETEWPPAENVASRLNEGREMVRVMPGTEWRARTPRKRDGEVVV